MEQTKGQPTAYVNLVTERFETGKASDDDWRELNRFRNRLRSDHWPSDPPERLERTKLSARSAEALWCVRAPREIVAAGVFGNLLDIYVLQERRRQGLARQLLELMAETARTQGRRQLETRTDADTPAGEAFARLIGGQLQSTWVTSELALADVDRHLMLAWVESAPQRAPGFKLGFWDGPCPEEKLERTTVMFQVMSEAHGKDPDHVLTVEDVRKRDAKRVEDGVGRWTMYAEDGESGEYAGFTAISLDPHEEEILHQGDTGVAPKFRGRGLGRWLKAAMMEKVLNELPNARLIRTGNEAGNEPMIRINHDMGFEPRKTFHRWTFDLDRVEAYLSARRD